MFAASKTDGSAVAPDAQFNYVTMLLHGDGTNGAQNNTFVDSSTNNFTITRNGNTTQGSFSPYGSNWSNYFGGSSDLLTLPSNAAWTLGSTFTIEAWVNPAVFSANSKRICQADSGIDLSVNSSGFINFNAATTTTALSLNVWSHVAFVSNSGTSTLYINGVASGFTGTNTGVNVAGTSTLTVGTYQTNSGYAWQGYISNFRIVKSSAVYTSNFTPSTTPLTAITNTQLLTCQSNRFIDNSTNNYTITVNGPPSVQRFNPFGASTAYSTSVIGGSGYFDGTGDYLNLGNQTALHLGSGSFTVEMWVYKNANTAYMVACGDLLANTTNTFQIVGDATGSKITWYDGLGGAFTLTSTASIPINAWTHIAFVRNSTTLTLYINGVSDVSTTYTRDLNATTSFFVGQTPELLSSRYWNGYISDLRVVKGSAVYTSAFTPPTAPLTAITNTSLLTNFTNGAIFDNAMMNDLETVGNAQISTSVKKYGTGSMYFDGNLDGLFTPSTPNLAFGTGDFTVEFWLYLAANLNTFAKVVMMGTTGNCFTIEAQGTANVLNLTNLTSTVYVTSSTALTTGTWIHVAATRASGTLRLFQNGTQVGSAANTVDFPNTGGIYIGRSNTGQETNGYIDDLRITKGYARYTTTFTPPTSALSDTGPI